MSLKRRVDAVEAELAKQNGETGFKVVLRATDERDNEARMRLGLADWPGLVIFIDEKAANL